MASAGLEEQFKQSCRRCSKLWLALPWDYDSGEAADLCPSCERRRLRVRLWWVLGLALAFAGLFLAAMGPGP